MKSLFSLNFSFLHFPTNQQHTLSEVAFCFSDLFAQLSFWNYVQNKQSRNMHWNNHKNHSDFYIWFQSTSGKNHPAFLAKLLGDACLASRTDQIKKGSLKVKFWIKTAFHILKQFLCAA